ncbi:MAG: FG-GAP-like repeat-containing protein, partial [Armatimonadota bacterium]
AGDRETLFHVFYAAGGSGQPAVQVREVNDNVAVSRGALNLIAGTGSFEMGDFSVNARHFIVGPETVLLIGATKFAGTGVTLTADTPFNLSAQATEGAIVIEVATETTIGITAARGVMRAERTLEPGTHTLPANTADLFTHLQAAHESAWANTSDETVGEQARETSGFNPGATVELSSQVVVVETADMDGDGEDELLAGCDDGTLVALKQDGNELWRHQFEGRVNALDGVDIDGDGKAEIAVGADDEHAHLLAGDGNEIWNYHVPPYFSNGGGPGHVTAIHAADFDGDGSPDIAIGSENTHCYVLNAGGELKVSDDEPWQFRYKHTVYELDAADVNGDGHLELLAGYQYPARWIIDFTATGDRRAQHLPGAKAGSSDVAMADLEGDGVFEGIYAESDGALRAARQAEKGDSAEVLWETFVGDDAIGAIVCGNFDDDPAEEIVVASHSGFVGLVESDGVPAWVRYAGNAVTDITAISREGEMPVLLRSSEDGSVAAYTAAGHETAWWQVGEPVEQVEAISGTVVAVTGSSLRFAEYAP